MRPAFRRGWEGEGKPESMPWRGPAGTARHTGVSIPVWGTRGQSPWCSNSRIAKRSSQQWHPCNGVKPPDALRARKCASGCPAIREARVPAGQHRKHRTLRSAQRGTECVCQCSRSTSHAPDRLPDGPGLQARSAPADRAGRPLGQHSNPVRSHIKTQFEVVHTKKLAISRWAAYMHLHETTERHL